MADRNLVMMLRHRAEVKRAVTAALAGMNPLSPAYEQVAEEVPVLVQPLQGDLVATVAGRVPEATHVAYAEAGLAVEAGDVLVVGERTYEVLSVEDEAGQGHHVRMAVRG